MEPGRSTDWWSRSVSEMASHAHSLTSGASPRRGAVGRLCHSFFLFHTCEACSVEIQLEAPRPLAFKKFQGTCLSDLKSAHVLCSLFPPFPSDAGVNTLGSAPPGLPSAATVQGLCARRRWDSVLGGSFVFVSLRAWLMMPSVILSTPIPWP